MSGFRPANKKFDQLRKGPGTPRGASKNVLRPPPVRSFFTILANSRLRALARVAEHPGRLPKRLERLWKGPPKPLETPFWAFLHIEAMRRYMYVTSTYTHTRLNTAIRLSAYPSSGLPSYRLTVLPSCRLIVSTSCRLSALPPHTLTISRYYHLNVFCFTVLQFYRVARLLFCRLTALPPCCLTALMSHRPAVILIQRFTVLLP